MPNSFVTCILEQMERKGFGKKRANDLVERFEGLSEYFRQQGVADPELQAMTLAFNELHEQIAEKSKRAMETLIKYADNKATIEDPYITNTGLFRPTNTDILPSRTAIMFIEADPRSGVLSYDTERRNVRGHLWAVGNDILEKMGKGIFGIQRGKAYLDNVVDEIFGANSGDAVAKQLAATWKKTQELGVDLVNSSGGSLRKLKTFHLPQMQNSAKIAADGFEKWAANHGTTGEGWLDWRAMAWPDGTPIPVARRMEVLKEVFLTKRSGGVNKIEPGKFNGRGAAIGNALEEHRFLVYKDAASWRAMHEKYGDGNVFDVMVAHIDDMSHRIGLLRSPFGSNPQRMKDTISALALRQAHEIDEARGLAPTSKRSVVSRTEAELKNTFNPMFERMMRQNPMDVNSIGGNLVHGLSNILVSAQLGAAALIAGPGDFVTTKMVANFNKMNGFGGTDWYLKSIAGDTKFMRQISTQSGFVSDEVISSNYSMQRYSGINTYGPQITKVIAEVVMRMSLLSPHTRSARWATQAEFMGLMSRDAGKAMDDLLYREVFGRYGITAKDWDAFRTSVQPWTPRKDVNFLRPIDMLQTTHADRDMIFRKFQGMIFEESRKMVPEGTIEGSVILRGTTRPDTLRGALLHSFGMYKNFPISVSLIYGRLAMTDLSQAGRLKFVAGLGASMIFAGAMGTQMREISQGRDPLPMDTPQFFGKALLASGGMSIWGDFLFAGVNQFGGGPEETAAGPMASFASDVLDLALSDPFAWGATVGTMNDPGKLKLPALAVDFARRYTPGSSIWWARAALQRQVFDRLEELANPRAYQRRRRRAKNQRETFGNESWWPTGERKPQRAPSFEGVLGQ